MSARSREVFTEVSSLLSSILHATIEAVILGVPSLYVKSISALSVIIHPTASCASSSVYCVIVVATIGLAGSVASTVIQVQATTESTVPPPPVIAVRANSPLEGLYVRPYCCAVGFQTFTSIS